MYGCPQQAKPAEEGRKWRPAGRTGEGKGREDARRKTTEQDREDYRGGGAGRHGGGGTRGSRVRTAGERRSRDHWAADRQRHRSPHGDRRRRDSDRGGTWPVGLTLGSLLATGTGVVLLTTPAVCLALASAAGATTLAAVALAAGVTAAGAAIVVLIIENEYARGVIGRAVDKLKEAGRAGFPWALQLFNGATLEAARLETTPKPFVGPPQLVGPIVLVPGWIHAYQPGFNPLGGYGMFPGVAGTGEGF